jgi:hypothetical protein
VEAVALATRQPLWLVGAESCVFARLELAAVPARHRARAIAQRARQLAPFAEPGWHAAERDDGRVLLWCWDAAQVRATIDEANAANTRWSVLPEQIFFAPRDGACLRQCDGARVLERWEHGALACSVAVPPSASNIDLWLRAAGLSPGVLPPEAEAALVSGRWDRAPRDWKHLVKEPMAAGGVLLALASLWLVWSLGELGGQQLANHRLATRIERDQERLAPLLAEREQALALATRNQHLVKLLGKVDAVEAAAEFEFLVGERYEKILEWEYTGKSLRVTLEDDAPDNRGYVEALEASPWFDRVSISPALRPNQLSLEVTLSTDTSVRPAYASAAAGKGDAT